MLLGLLTFGPSLAGAVIAARATQQGWCPAVHSIEMDLVFR